MTGANPVAGFEAAPSRIPLAPPVRTAFLDFDLWGTSARIVVTDPAVLARARRVAEPILAEVELACSRFRDDSELVRIAGRASEGVDVSPMFATLVAKSLEAARMTRGDVDPTLGRVLDGLGYGRDLRMLPHAQHGSEASFSVSVSTPRPPGWTRVSLEGATLTVPDDLVLDLGATAKAVAADLCAAAIADEPGCGTLVALGGDIATAGPPPAGGWTVTAHDLPHDPEATVTLAAGFAVATSSTQKRRWVHEGRQIHHILDPRLGLPAPPVWRSVTVAASTCFEANTLSTAAIVRGRRAISMLERVGAAARLVDTQGRVVVVNGWPDGDAETYREVVVA